jgi:5-methylcytosine-specific restriction protein A
MIAGVPRPCLRCGTLTQSGSLCPDHAAQAERERSKRRGARHYDATYRRRAKAVRESAVVCWICGEGARAGDPWTADHVIPGDASPSTPLLPAHRSCNSRRGNRIASNE